MQQVLGTMRKPSLHSPTLRQPPSRLQCSPSGANIAAWQPLACCAVASGLMWEEPLALEPSVRRSHRHTVASVEAVANTCRRKARIRRVEDDPLSSTSTGGHAAAPAAIPSTS